MGRTDPSTARETGSRKISLDNGRGKMEADARQHHSRHRKERALLCEHETITDGEQRETQALRESRRTKKRLGRVASPYPSGSSTSTSGFLFVCSFLWLLWGANRIPGFVSLSAARPRY